MAWLNLCDKDLFNHEICLVECLHWAQVCRSPDLVKFTKAAISWSSLNASKVVSQVTQNRFYFAWEFKNKLYIITQITFKLISFQLPKNNFTFFIKNWSPSVMKYMLDVENTGNKRKVSHLLCFNSEIILLT